jgi:hypothetical protein
VADTTPRQSDCTVHVLTAARLYLNSPPEAPKRWGKTNPSLNNYRPNLMEICCRFRIPDLTNRWHQQEDTQPKYTDLSNAARDMFSIVLHGVAVEPGCSLGQDVSSWTRSKTTSDTLWEKSLQCSLIKLITGFSQEMTQLWI